MKYVCKFCNDVRKNANSLRNHERLCKNNPNKQDNSPSQKTKDKIAESLKNIAKKKRSNEIIKYFLNPVYCAKCNKPLKFSKRNGKFCNHSCAASFTNIQRGSRTQITKDKISKTINENKLIYCVGNICILDYRKCEFCEHIYLINPKSTRKNCGSSECKFKQRSKSAQGSGGYRQGSGRGKHGWCRGIYCDSSWELAYVLYNTDHNIRFERNKEGFEYEFENKIRKYFPDFIVDGKYVEIKGYDSPQWQAKLEQFPHKIEVLQKEEIKKYIDYASKKYGNFIGMYE